MPLSLVLYRALSTPEQGSSLPASVRPRAEKDPENTKGQVGQDTRHRTPCSSRSSTPYSDVVHAPVLGLGPMGSKTTVRQEPHKVQGKYGLEPSFFSPAPVYRGYQTQNETLKCFRAGKPPSISQGWHKALRGEGTCLGSVTKLPAKIRLAFRSALFFPWLFDYCCPCIDGPTKLAQTGRAGGFCLIRMM